MKTLHFVGLLTLLVPSMASGPAQSVTPPLQVAHPQAGRTSLQGALSSLEPRRVWESFHALTRIPRTSHHEEQASRFVADIGRNLGLETTVDTVGNVLIRKPATARMEQRQCVVLQAHLDMVAQKTPDKVFDFEKDKIEAYVEAGWVKADRTTLGADNGIGVAIILAILQAKDLIHGPIEALFTVDEEDNGTGATALKPGVLRGSVLISLDSETEGSLCIGSAGGVYVDGKATYLEEKTPADMAAYHLSVAGLQGGHSGLDINKGRGSAAKLLARWLWSAGSQFGVRVATMAGGDRYNAIPREATALVVVPAVRANALERYVQAFEHTVRAELATTEPNFAMRATPADLPATVMDAKGQQDLIGAVYGSPDGVTRMSNEVSGLVETSSSLGILKIGGGKFIAGIYVRSTVDSGRDDLAQRLLAVFRLGGMEAMTNEAFSGWRPNTNSAILRLMRQSYKTRFGVAPIVTALHCGLEASYFGVTYPRMDMISVGPTLVDVHSPDERVEVASVLKLYELLTETLKRIPQQQ